MKKFIIMPLILTLLTIFNIFCLNKSDKKYDNNYQQSVFNYDTLYNDYLYYKLYDYLLNDAIKEYKFKKKTIFYSKNEYDSLYNDSVCYYIKNNDTIINYITKTKILLINVQISDINILKNILLKLKNDIKVIPSKQKYFFIGSEENAGLIRFYFENKILINLSLLTFYSG